MTKSFNTTIEDRLGCLWITFNDSIDMDNYKAIEDSIFQKIKESSSLNIVIDLSKTLALFSSGVGVIMRMHLLINEHNKKLFLVNVSEKVQEGLETMGLNRVLKIYPSTEAFQSDLEDSAEQ